MELTSQQTDETFIRHNKEAWVSDKPRRSVDWRDSGIVIDDDQQFMSVDTIYDFNSKVGAQIGTIISGSTSSSTSSSNSSTSSCNFERFVSDQDEDGDTILHLAVVGCTLNNVKDLIKICDLDAINNMMQTPLHVAVLANRPEMIELLIASNAKLYLHDRRGNTPLHLACQKGYADIVSKILQFTSGADGLTTKILLEATNFEGLTCLHLAAIHNQAHIIELLVNEHGANLNCQDSRSGDTILHKAISNFNIDLVELILRLEKHCNQADYSGRRPLETIKILLSSKADRGQQEILMRAEHLIRERIINCHDVECCGCEDYKQTYDQILDLSSSSDFSDSDSDINPS